MHRAFKSAPLGFCILSCWQLGACLTHAGPLKGGLHPPACKALDATGCREPSWARQNCCSTPAFLASRWKAMSLSFSVMAAQAGGFCRLTKHSALWALFLSHPIPPHPPPPRGTEEDAKSPSKEDKAPFLSTPESSLYPALS